MAILDDFSRSGHAYSCKYKKRPFALRIPGPFESLALAAWTLVLKLLLQLPFGLSHTIPLLVVIPMLVNAPSWVISRGGAFEGGLVTLVRSDIDNFNAEAVYTPPPAFNRIKLLRRCLTEHVNAPLATLGIALGEPAVFGDLSLKVRYPDKGQPVTIVNVHMPFQAIAAAAGRSPWWLSGDGINEKNLDAAGDFQRDVSAEYGWPKMIPPTRPKWSPYAIFGGKWSDASIVPVNGTDGALLTTFSR